MVKLMKSVRLMNLHIKSPQMTLEQSMIWLLCHELFMLNRLLWAHRICTKIDILFFSRNALFYRGKEL